MFTLPESELVQVQDARVKGVLPVDVFSSDGKSQLAQGTLLTPNNTIDTTTGTISLKAQFTNDDDHLWPGEFVNARVQVNTLHNAVTIPELAVVHGPDGLFVYLVKADHTVAQANMRSAMRIMARPWSRKDWRRMISSSPQASPGWRRARASA